MGYITEPKGVDFIIAPSKPTDKDTETIRKAISDYKQANKTAILTEILVQPANENLEIEKHLQVK